MKCDGKPTRFEWDDFPDVIIHSSIYRLKNLPGYYAAKFGNHDAATRIANSVTKTDKLSFTADFVVPIIQIDDWHYNAIPVAFAALLARELGARLWLEICQINKVDHTGANAIARIKNQPCFGGRVPPGTCLICDDVVTYGGSLANLRGFLMKGGAKVIAATTMGAAYGSTKLSPENTLIQDLQTRYGQELETFTGSLGFKSECLTSREAFFLSGLRTAQRLRDCFAEGPGSPDRREYVGV
jgi:hypothetical protein